MQACDEIPLGLEKAMKQALDSASAVRFSLLCLYSMVKSTPTTCAAKLDVWKYE